MYTLKFEWLERSYHNICEDSRKASEGVITTPCPHKEVSNAWTLYHFTGIFNP